MFSRILAILIKQGMLSWIVVGLGLVVLGNAINATINWNWLTYFFVIFRSLLSIIWFLPFDTIFTLLSYSFTIIVAWWSFKAAVLVADWFIKS